MTTKQDDGLAVETPKTSAPAGKKQTRKKATAKKSLIPASRAAQQTLEVGSEILFKVKRIHGYHGTVLNVTPDGELLCRINEEALEGTVVVFSADQLVLAKPNDQETHHSDRLPWDYKS